MPADYKDRARRRAKERNETYWWKPVGSPKSGTDNTFRILPTPESKTTPAVFYEYQVHRNVGPKKRLVRCGKDAETGTGRCWLCDKKIPSLESAGKQARAAALQPQTTMLIQVAVIGDDNKLDGPFGWNPSPKVATDIIGSVLGSKKRDYADAKKGHNLTINRVGTGMLDTRYGMIEPDDDATVVPDSIMKKLRPFSEVKELVGYDEAIQKAAYEGRDIDARDADDDDDDEDEEEVEETEEDEEESEETESEEEEEEEAPVKPAAKTGKKKPAPEPEEDEEEEEAEEEEEEEPVKPKKGAKTLPAKKKPAPVEEEEEDPWEDEDEEAEVEEEPEPTKKKKKPAPVVEEEEEVEEELEEEVEEEPEEEEEEEPAPPPKKKKAAPPPPVRKGKK